MVFALVTSGCGTGVRSLELQPAATLSGNLHGGQQPVTGALIQVYAVGTSGDGSAATPLVTTRVTTSDGSANAANGNANAGNAFNALPAGSFLIPGGLLCPSASTQIYVTATGGNPGLAPGTNNGGIAMLAVLGRCGDLTVNSVVNINELTTVASLAPLAGYMTGLANLGSGTGDLQQFLAALALVRSYVDVNAGAVPGPDLAAGYYASSVEITTLADILAVCINSDGGAICTQLYGLATPQGGVAPTNIVSALLNILRNPTLNTAALFNLLGPNPPFQPTLTSAPAAWTFPILPYAATPVISPAGGTYSTVPTITITDPTPNAAIFYTVDGGAPAAYSGPFTLPSNGTIARQQVRVVQAFARAAGFATSASATTTYTLPAAGIASGLGFLRQPVTSVVSTTLAPIQVSFVDAYGAPVARSGRSITIALGNNPSGATLSSRSPTLFSGSDGSVTFSDLSLDRTGVGYTLVASSPGYTSATSSAFDVTLPPIVLNVAGSQIGTGATLAATFTLPTPAPAGGTTVSLSSSNPAVVTISPATVALNAGDTVGSFTYTSVGPGTSTLRAAAPTYVDGTATETTSTSFITLGALPTAPGTFQNLPVTLSQPAPAGGITVTLQSSNTTVAFVSSSVSIAGGATQPATLPLVQARSFGTSLITATAPGYAPDAQLLKAAGSATLTQGLSTSRGSIVAETITINSAPGSSLTFNLRSDNTAIATVPNFVILPAGSTTVTFNVTGIGVGSVLIHASAAGVPDASASVAVTGFLSVPTSQPAAMLTSPATIALGSPALTPVSITLTSSNPAVLLLSTVPGVTGSASITVNNVTGSSVNFYEQGLAVGSSNITVTSPSYATSVASVAVGSPFFGFQTTFPQTVSLAAGPRAFSASLGVSSGGHAVGFCGDGGGGLTPLGCTLNPGVTFSVPIILDVTTVGSPLGGTISANSVTFQNGATVVPLTFTPTQVGGEYIRHGAVPSGFQFIQDFDSFALYVVQPTFTLPNSDLATSPGVTYPIGSSLSIVDNSTAGTTVTVSIANGSLASLSTDPAVMGTSSLTLTGIHSALPTIYVQGLALGSTTLSFSANGYKAVTAPYNVSAGSLNFDSRFDLSAATSSMPSALNLVLSARGVVCFQSNQSFCFLNPNVSPTVNVNSSNAAVGTVASYTFAPMSAIAYSAFTPLSGGTTTLSIATPPAPLTAPNAAYGRISLIATVSQSTFATFTAPITGANVQVGTSFFVGANSASSTLQVTSSDPQTALVSKSATALGSASITFPAGTTASWFVQGLKPGTVTLTLAAPGYTTGTFTVSVLNTAIIFANDTSTLNTSAFASSSGFPVYLAEVYPATGVVYALCANGYCSPNPGATFTANVTVSDTNIGTVTSPVTINNATSKSTVNFLPNDVGVATISIAGPAGTDPSVLNRTVNVTGDTAGVPDLRIGAGTYTSTSVSLGSIPGRPISVTVTLADPSIAVLSTDPNVMGTQSSLTFNNITCFSYLCSNGGGPPVFYVQGKAPGYTKINIVAQGYTRSSSTVAVNKVGLTFSTISTQVVTGIIGSTQPANAVGRLSYLDPYSLSYLSDCSCSLNPGMVTPSLTVNTDDPTVGVFGVTAAYNSTNQFITVPYTALRTGFTNYSLGTQPSGYSTTTTPARRVGIASSTPPSSAGPNTLFIAAHDVDAGVGVEVVGNFSLSATVSGYYSTPFTITVADPTIAVVSYTSDAAGAASIAATTFAYIDNPFYIQGLKAGTTTVTVSHALYASRTFTVTVRPAGFVFKQFDYVANIGGINRTAVINFTPAVLNDQGQWMANAQLNPQGSAATVQASLSSAGAGTLSAGTIAVNGTAGSFSLQTAAVGPVTVLLGTPSGPFIQPTTYQAVTVTIK